MKKTIFILIIVIIAGGWSWYTQNKPKEKSIIDCGMDTECFDTNFKSCTRSKLYGGAIEILNGTTELCNIIFRNEGVADINNGEMLIMECTIYNSDLFKNKAKEFGYAVLSPALVYDDENALCKGSLYDFYIDMTRQANEIMKKAQKQ